MIHIRKKESKYGNQQITTIMLKTSGDIEVKDWNDLQEKIFTGSWDKSIKRFRSPYVFKGHYDKSHVPYLNRSAPRSGDWINIIKIMVTLWFSLSRHRWMTG